MLRWRLLATGYEGMAQPCIQSYLSFAISNTIDKPQAPAVHDRAQDHARPPRQIEFPAAIAKGIFSFSLYQVCHSKENSNQYRSIVNSGTQAGKVTARHRHQGVTLTKGRSTECLASTCKREHQFAGAPSSQVARVTQPTGNQKVQSLEAWKKKKTEMLLCRTNECHRGLLYHTSRNVNMIKSQF